MPDENIKLLTAGLEALNARDEEAIQAVVTDELEWRPAVTAGGSLERKVYRGKRAMIEYWTDLDADFDETRFFIERVEPIGTDRVLYRGRVTARGKASGVPLDLAVWGLWQIRDGKLVRGTAFRTEAEALEAAGPSE
jgi:ketosteroid isomerase-like protein